jgi:hypothetical protein
MREPWTINIFPEVIAGRLTGNFNNVIFFLLIMLLVRRPTATIPTATSTNNNMGQSLSRFIGATNSSLGSSQAEKTLGDLI